MIHQDDSAPRPGNPPANDNRGIPRVVIADDDPDALDLLDEALHPLGIQVQRAASGAELVLLLAGHGPFDLVVTDIDMPWTEGLGVIRSARAAEVETPVLFVSGLARPDLDASVAQLGNARIVRKPVDIAALRQAVRELLAVGRERRPPPLDVGGHQAPPT